MKGGLPPGSIPTLKQFLLRSEVLKLYRQFIRTVKEVSDSAQRKEFENWIRHDFRRNKHITDEESIRMMITRGRMSLKELETTVEMAK
ncbi:hypothetical protein ScPMuIL_012556 [Solemya velum]